MTAWVGAVIAGAGALGGAALGASASKSAASSQEAAANSANQTALQEQSNAQQFLQPYQGAGQSVLPQLQSILSGNTTGLANLPGYQFALSQGQQAITNSAAGGLLNGNTLSALQNNAIGTANQFVGQDISELQNFANMGANAAAGQASGALQTGQTIGANTIGAGNAAAAGTVGVANALTGGLNTGLNTYLQSQLLSSLNNQPLSQANVTQGPTTMVNTAPISSVSDPNFPTLPSINPV